jgi:hypothetical protein
MRAGVSEYPLSELGQMPKYTWSRSLSAREPPLVVTGVPSPVAGPVAGGSWAAAKKNRWCKSSRASIRVTLLLLVCWHMVRGFILMTVCLSVCLSLESN